MFKTSLAITLLAILIPLQNYSYVSAASLSSDLKTFTLSEAPSASNHEAVFNLKLSPNPTDNVTTSFNTNGECLIGPYLKNYANGGAVYTKNDTIPFGIRAYDDSNNEGNHICSVEFSSQSILDPAYATPAKLTFKINITDNDSVQNYSYSLTTLSTSTLEEGGNTVERYQIEIGEAPNYDVRVEARADDQCDILSSGSQTRVKQLSGVFKAGRQQAIFIEITSAEDSEFEGLHQCTITHTASTTDKNFQSVPIPNYTAQIKDDEVNPNIPDEREYEGGIIYYKDANADDIEDSKQANVESFINPLTGERQAVLITDSQSNLLNGCAFVGEPFIEAYDGSETGLVSSQGLLNVEVSCSADVNYRILWLLDGYNEYANDWTMYDASQPGSLSVLGYTDVVFDLNNDFTSGLSIDLDNPGKLRILQTDPRFLSEAPADYNESLAAQVSNSRLHPLAILAILSLVSCLGWLIYYRHFSNVDTTKSRFPTIDRF